MKQNQVLGSGKLYFDQFLPGTSEGIGELYLGNTPSLSVSSIRNSVARYESLNGVKRKVETYDVGEEHGVSFTTDDISSENMALWFGGPSVKENRPGSVPQVFPFNAYRGREYQIGKNAARPSGCRNIGNVKVLFVDGSAVDGSNFSLNPATGRIAIATNARDLPDGISLRIEFAELAAKVRAATSGGRAAVGSLRFVSNNLVGANSDYYWPKVKLSPSGDTALKADSWQSLSFSVEVLKLNGITEMVYVDEHAAVSGRTLNQEQALEEFGSESRTVFYINKFYRVIHQQLPSIDF